MNTSDVRSQIDNTLLLFAKQLRAVDYNRVRKLITPEKEAIDRAEFHANAHKDIEALIETAIKAERTRIVEIACKSETDIRWDAQWRNGYNSAKAEVRKILTSSDGGRNE